MTDNQTGKDQKKRERDFSTKIWSHSWGPGKFKPKDNAAAGWQGVEYKAARFPLQPREAQNLEAAEQPREDAVTGAEDEERSRTSRKSEITVPCLWRASHFHVIIYSVIYSVWVFMVRFKNLNVIFAQRPH